METTSAEVAVLADTEPTKDAIIRQQQAIIGDAVTTINKQRCRIADLEYHIHQHDLLYQHPWQYFFWRICVWPFHPNNNGGGQ